MPNRVLIIGTDHPHRGKTGTLTGEVEKVAGIEMACVDLDQEGLGASSCYAEAKDLQPTTSDYRGKAA